MPALQYAIDLLPIRAAQSNWALTPIAKRLELLKALRHIMATRCRWFSEALDRPEHETLSAELLPLLEGCRFLERFAESILKPKRWGRHGRPLWLFGVSLETRREPFGVVLVIGPSNYPLFLAAAQLLQALTAGNAVVLKPGRGGLAVGKVFCECIADAGFDGSLVTLLGEDPQEGASVIQAGVDKVVLTGSFATGTSVLQLLAGTATPSVMELSGDDAVFVRNDANPELVVGAVEFALRLNRGNTCIAPKRVLVAENIGNEVHSLLLQRGLDIPVISVKDDEEALAIAAKSRFALGAAVFGGEPGARSLAGRIRAGTVVINDVIVPTADPRLPFGGRGASGFGVTRGAEGLLEMTVVKAITTRSGTSRPHYSRMRPQDADLFTSCIGFLHGESIAGRVRALSQLCREVVARRNYVS
ncbi:MAG: aldehyde dehydrogenase family protein [Bryobacteraceae bacterium]